MPEKYQERFVNYLDVDHLDRKRVRKMYVNPEAHAAAQADQELPDGTVLIMEDHDAKTDAGGNLVRDADGRLIALEPVSNIFVMEKNAAWTTDNGHWDYAWYLPNGIPKPDAKFEGCFSCHTSRAERDFTFTFWKFVSDQKK
ncbi:cytochrome P460 family protein [Sinorhizobium numidicum]|uniref:Cytochrome P460 family protein n=1 Tax=Sinorhizobium numidicum TaxID=680248 RepID=A0ABY8CN01_9HYPH|nr:cytochrome P460 family protein [Sinorhizobium numidicum]WEX74019.1 cytochrome P460 family protein [Sinorhizobium numidicum]WEX80004.1 cytochrome P460 family protein [Sinorhizobium numidicum]